MADRGAMDKAKGKAKEAVGKVTGNDRLTAEGKIDQVKGEAKEAKEDAKDALRGKRRRT
ncbi:CsbD family protein [Streptomyces sp. NPDC090077]|uniref:CsbD family protein n=1 Tax=Streptomyces sp. NPDC090077 TaxID=3365938 RepID=UPI00382E45EF